MMLHHRRNSGTLYVALSYAVANATLHSAGARAQAQLRYEYRSHRFVWRWFKCAFWILPILWSLYGLTMGGVFALEEFVGPVVEVTCLLGLLAGALLQTYRQLRWAITGEVG